MNCGGSVKSSGIASRDRLDLLIGVWPCIWFRHVVTRPIIATFAQIASSAPDDRLYSVE